MKHSAKTGAFLLAVCMLLRAFSWAGFAEETTLNRLHWEQVTQHGPSNSCVSYPLFSGNDEASQSLADTLNQTIQNLARIPDYLQVLSTVMEGGTGIQVTFEFSNDTAWSDSTGMREETAPFLSLLFSAKGKMPIGRPSQAYYPMTLDMRTGEAVEFDRLFTDPAGAKEFIEAYLADEIEPQLSTYLENSQLFPVPFDRFFLDGFGRVIIVYENSQLSFLSGYSGAVAFRYSELWDYLDTSADGVPMQVLWHDGSRYDGSRSDVSFDEHNAEWLYNDSLYGLSADLYLGQPLEEALQIHRATVDSGYYPGGAYYEVENPVLRGTLILTDGTEAQVTGLLTSRVDHFGIETGKTHLSDAELLMNGAPLHMAIDETTAALYLVCPGTASVYSFTDQNERQLSFILYADENDVVQYIKLAYTD